MAVFVAAVASFSSFAASPGETVTDGEAAATDSVAAVIPREATGGYLPLTETVAKDEPADSTAAGFFVSAPISIFPTIDPLTRMDMIDYFQAGSDKPSKNLIGGECRITEDTPDKLVFSTSEVSEYTIVLLPAPSAKLGKIILLSRTLKTPAEDSTVSFYDTGWNKIEGVSAAPTFGQWLLPEAKKNRKDVENAVPFILARFEYSVENRSATFTNTLQDYLPEESLGIAKSSIRGSLTYKWDGKRFVMEK